MHTNSSLFGIACRAAAFTFLIAGTSSLMHAQQAASPVSKAPFFLASSAVPDFTSLVSDNSTSSSSSDDATSDSFDPSSPAPDSSQPPPRRRYGRPSYSGGNTNPDGSPKYTFMAGAGAAVPVGITHRYDTPSWDFQVGGGRNPLDLRELKIGSSDLERQILICVGVSAQRFQVLLRYGHDFMPGFS